MRVIGKIDPQEPQEPVIGKPVGTMEEDNLFSKVMSRLTKPAQIATEPVKEMAKYAYEGPANPEGIKDELAPNAMDQYPSAQFTGAPTLDVLAAGQVAKEAAVLGGKAVAGTIGRVIGNIAEKKALGRVIGNIKDLDAAASATPKMTSPITAEPVTELTHATRTDAAKNIMKGGFDPSKRGTGADEIQDVKGFMGEGVSMAKNPNVALANVEGALAKGETSLIKGYVPEKGVLKVTKETHPDVYDQLISPDPNVTKPIAESILKDAKDKGFKAVSFPDGETVVTDSKAIRLLESNPVRDTAKQLEFPKQEPKGLMFNKKQLTSIEKELGSPLPRAEATFGKLKQGAADPIDLKKGIMVPPNEQRKALTRAADDVMREPIQEDLPMSGMLEGAEKRIKNFATLSKTTKDIDPHNPITSRYEMNKNLGALESTAREQLQSAAKAEVAGEQIAAKKLNDLYKEFKFKPESVESAAVKVYGESQDKIMAQGLLKNAVGEEKANKIIQAEAKMAAYYKDYLERLRKSGLNIAERKDYHNHISEINLLNDLGLMSKAGTKQGDEMAARMLSDFEQSKVNKFMRVLDVPFKHLKRQGKESLDDAVQGFERYAKESERYIAMQPYVKELQATADAVEETMPNLAMFLRNQSDYIAGKKQSIDSAIQSVVGPEAFRGFVELTSRMKGNILQANPNVAYSQLFSEPVIAGAVPMKDYVVGGFKALANPEFRAFMMKNSPVLQKRALDNAERSRYVSKPVKALDSVTSFLDTNIVGHAWSAKFNQLIGQGKSIDEAIPLAEEFAAMTQGFLSKTNTPEALRSQTAQSLMPFMNQVLAQSRYVTREMFKNKSLAGKAGTAAKMLAVGAAVGTVGAMFGQDDPTAPINPTNYIPMGPAVERGLGGPVISTGGRIIKADTLESKIIEAIKGLLLAQKKIPAGLMVGRGIDALLKEGN